MLDKLARRPFANPTTLIPAIAILLMTIVVLPVTADDGAATKSIDKPLPPECALLDDFEKRALMDGLLLKLAIICDRTEFLGVVRQEPNMEVGAPDIGTDVPVNDPSGDSGSSTTQSETSLAVSETTGTICSGFNDSYHGVVQGSGYTGFARSTDGGATFSDGLGLGSGNFGDPAMIWRKADENFYLATLGSTGIRIYQSVNDCETFQLLGNIHNGSSDDKELMAVDNDPTSPHYGNLYVVWTDFGTGGDIRATRSTDGGLTWGATQTISSGFSVQGAWPTVGPDGTVYASWVEFSSGITIRVSKSTDGGTTWSAVTAPAVNKVQPQDAAATGSCGRAALKGNIRYLPSPQIAVGPDHVVHVIYTYDPDTAGTGDTVSVFYRRSTDQGATWETEVLVNDDGTDRDQFFPTLSVGQNNTVSAAWYDRRDDPNNTLVDYYQRLSYDGGVNWEPSVRISDVSTPIYLDPNLAGCYHGDYDTQVQTETAALIQWSDDRRTYNSHNDPDVYLDTVPVCLLTGILPPTATAGVGGDNLIQIGFNDSATPEIAEYRVFRSFFAGGPYDLIATVDDSSPGSGGGLGYTYNDFDVSGGTEYFYVVRSSDGAACLSDPSDEVSAVATGVCTLPPLFGGIETVVNPGSSVCSLDLGWSAATSRCAGDVTYNVYRSTTQGFTPGPLNRVASGVAGTSYLDGGPLQSLVRHYYVVRAVDTVNSAEEQNIEEGSGVTTGPFSIGTWIDDAGDTGEAALSTETPWSVAATGGNLGPQVYLTGTYGNNLCASVTTPSMMLSTGSTLSFWSKYQIENSWDKGVVEISSDGGANWEKVPVNYPGTSTNTGDECGLPVGDYFTGTTGLTWTEYTAPLVAWEGLDVMLRWRFSSDVSLNGSGWWVDDIAITNVMVPSNCDSEPPLFADGFEDGTTVAWDRTEP